MNQSTAATEPLASEGEHLIGMLEEHVPISLIMDLSVPAGPDSRDILDTEGRAGRHLVAHALGRLSRSPAGRVVTRCAISSIGRAADS